MLNLLANLLLVLAPVAFTLEDALPAASKRACIGICREPDTFFSVLLSSYVYGWWSAEEMTEAGVPRLISLIDCRELALVLASAETSLIAVTICEKSCCELTALLRPVDTTDNMKASVGG